MPSEQNSTWQPILDGELRERAIELVRAIADTMLEPRPGLVGSLAGGSAGIALLHAYLARDPLFDADKHIEAAHLHLEHAIEEVARTVMYEGLYAGFSGIGWAVEHLHEQIYGQTSGDEGGGSDVHPQGEPGAGDNDGDDGDDGDANEQIDEALIDLVATSPWQRDYDLISGLIGIGVYGLERLPRESGKILLSHIVHRLDELGQRNADGITWHTAAEFLPPHQREVYQEGYYNLGVSHGLPGAVALLGQIHAAGIECDLASRLLDGALSWLWARKLPKEEKTYFDWAHDSRVPAHSARAAWCYGDPGIAAILVLADRLARPGTLDPYRGDLAAMIDSVAHRPRSSSGVADAAICHGSVGLAHVFNRLYQVTGLSKLRDEALHWIEWTLDARLDGAPPGVIRFRDEAPFKKGDPLWSDEVGLLTGSCGVALALWAAATNIEPCWDRMLLLSSAVAG